MCLYPRLIKNRKYTNNKKNKGVIPEVMDDRVLYVPVGCGKCIECMKQKKRNWQVRLLEEIREQRKLKLNALFVTLTFSEESLIDLYDIYENSIDRRELNNNKIIENEIATIAVRRLLERWRKHTGKSVKHWLVTELGHNGTERVHLHGILFTDKDEDFIKERWEYGYIWIGDYVNEKTINYIVKYINKIDTVHKGYIPKVLCSKGIGSGYLKRWDSNMNIYKGIDTVEYYKTSDGSKLNLPIYYRNKLYSDEEREKLWLMKLDKEERFVCGEKVSVKESEDNYFHLLEYYRKKNKRLGYGDDSSEWDKKNYIEKLNFIKRIKKLE